MDRRLRELERRWKETGSNEDLQRFINACRRSGSYEVLDLLRQPNYATSTKLWDVWFDLWISSGGRDPKQVPCAGDILDRPPFRYEVWWVSVRSTRRTTQRVVTTHRSSRYPDEEGFSGTLRESWDRLHWFWLCKRSKVTHVANP